MIYSDCTTYRDSGEWGYLVTDDKGRELSRYSTKKKFLGVAYAEALGVLDAIRFAPHGGQVGCDNQGLVNAIHKHSNGRRPKGDAKLRNVIANINKKCKDGKIEIRWVRREGNAAGIKHDQWLKGQWKNLPKGTMPAKNTTQKIPTAPLATDIHKVYTTTMNDYLTHLREFERKRKLRAAIWSSVVWLATAAVIVFLYFSLVSKLIGPQIPY